MAANAGRYPVVRGARTIAQFFDRVMDVPAPEGRFNFRMWLRSNGLGSSYFDDMGSFCRFIEMTDGQAATELWESLRGNATHGERLTDALNTVYGPLLKSLGIAIPDDTNRGRLVDFIKTTEKTSAADAASAAQTMLWAYDRALGREISAPETKTARLPKSSPATSTGTPKRPIEKPRIPAGASGRESQRIEMPQPQIAVQVNINPDMTSEQIDKVFESMARHLYRIAS